MNRTRSRVPALVVLAASGVLSLAVVATDSSPAAAAAPARHAAAVPGTPSADPARETVLVTGTGEVFGEPDTLTADLAVEATAATVGAALDQAVPATARTRDALVRAGVARADLRTANLAITPTPDSNGKITGYTVHQGLTVTVRHLAKAGSLLTSAIRAGGDTARLNGVSFFLEKDTGLIAEARRKAFADAKAKAESYAREAGRPLGRVVKISEPGQGYLEPVRADRMSTAMALLDSTLPIEPGRQRLSVTVTVEWILGTDAAPGLS